MWQKAIEKMLSGRYILTVVCALVFAYCSIQKTMPMDATISIVSMVFISYFNRGDRNPNGGAK